MTTLDDQIREIRAEWKKGAERLVKQLTKEQLEQVHRELEDEFKEHQYTDVKIYLDAFRAYYHKKYGGKRA